MLLDSVTPTLHHYNTYLKSYMFNTYMSVTLSNNSPSKYESRTLTSAMVIAQQINYIFFHVACEDFSGI